MPKISSSSRCLRTMLRAPQTAEQLVEVPTVVSFSLLQRIREQNVDILVPGGGGDLLVFKVFTPNRVQQRRSFLRNAFLS